MMDYTHTPNHFFSTQNENVYPFQEWHSTCPCTGTSTPGPWERLSADWGPGYRKCEKPKNIFLVLSLLICVRTFYVSVLTIFCFSWERYLAICHPIYLYTMAGTARTTRWVRCLAVKRRKLLWNRDSICFALHCGWSFIDEETDPQPRHIIR